jgi:uncharacterized repeat protein (TIGR01451 family)
MITRYWKLLLITTFALLLCLAVIAGLGTAPASASRPQSSALGPICTVDAGGGGDYTTIGLAVADTGCTTINVAAGVYTENVGIYRSLALHGAGSGSTFVDGNGYTTLYFGGASTVVTITDLTVQHGGRTSGDGNAGGLYNAGATLLIADAVIANNTANGDGAGIFNNGGSLTLSNTTVYSNHAGDQGGGIWNNGSLALVNSHILSNTSGMHGAGIYNANALTLTGTTVSYNDVGGAWHGGGIYSWGWLVTIQDSTVSWNHSDEGGGVASSNGLLTILRTNIHSNVAEDDGGGVWVYGSNASLHMEDSSVRGNTAFGDAGGGIFSDGDSTLINVDIVGNTSIDHGGGIHSQDPMTLTNVTVSGNEALFGSGVLHTGSVTMYMSFCSVVSNTVSGVDPGAGGVHAWSPVVFEATIVANNESGDCSDGTGDLISHGYNLDSDNSCDLTAGTDIPGTDPLLELVADNGGETWTHALKPGSPAMDAIPVQDCAIATDQRGASRPQGLACDIGAHEEGQVTLHVTKTTDDDNPEPGQIITFTITVHNSGLVGASDVGISDTLHPSLTLAGPIALHPPAAGTVGSGAPVFVYGAKIYEESGISVTFPVLVDVGLHRSTVITNTAAVTSSVVITPQLGWVRLSFEEYVYLPLVLRNW